MESALLGLVLDSSFLIAAERRNLTPDRVIETVQKTVGKIPVVRCALTVAEIGHGIYRASTPDVRQRRRAFLDELKATIPVYPVTDAMAEIVARIGGEEAAKGINLPLGISSSVPAPWNLAMRWALPMFATSAASPNSPLSHFETIHPCGFSRSARRCHRISSSLHSKLARVFAIRECKMTL